MSPLVISAHSSYRNFLYGKFSSFQDQPLPPPFRDSEDAAAAIIEFYRKCHEVSEKLLELFALALGVPVEHFRKWHSFGVNTTLSLIHYPGLDCEQRAALKDIDIRAGGTLQAHPSS